MKSASAKLDNSEDRTLFRTQFLKTRPCRFFQAGCCRRGSGCSFAHGKVSIAPDLTKTSLCLKWREGTCLLSSEDCPFAHGKEELRRSPLYKMAGMQHGYSKCFPKESPESCPTIADSSEPEPELEDDWYQMSQEEPVYLQSPPSAASASPLFHAHWGCTWDPFGLEGPLMPSPWLNEFQNLDTTEPLKVMPTCSASEVDDTAVSSLEALEANGWWAEPLGTQVEEEYVSAASSLEALMTMPQIMEPILGWAQPLSLQVEEEYTAQIC